MLLGRMIARSIWPERKERGMVILTTICSEFPDIDVFFSNGNPLQHLQIHRGLTHSILGASLLALLLAGVTKRWFLKERRFSTLYLASLGGLGIHIFFDLVTSYGTMLFYPFSKARLSFDTVFIVDPYIWLILLLPLLLRWRRGALFAHRNLIATIILALYLSLGFLNHGVAMHRLQRWTTAQ
ncbi:MAG: metal-dependent hydrolase, partial [Nitrospinota bacterium]